MRRNYEYCRRIKVKEVNGVIPRICRDRATRPNDIPVKFWKTASREAWSA